MSELSNSSGAGRAPGGFPETLWAVVAAAGSADATRSAEALRILCQIYREPVFRWLLSRGTPRHEAEDAVQDFVEHLLGKERLAGIEVCGARFRTYLLACLRNRMRDRDQARRALKRGGGAEHVDVAELQVAGPECGPDPELDREFARTVHQRALAAVEEDWARRGAPRLFLELRQFITREPRPGDYAAAAAALGLEAQRVKRVVFDLREFYLDVFRREVARTVVPEEFQGELAYLLSLAVSLF